MTHICIITRSTPTKNPRLIKEVQALLDAGYEVSVISGRHRGWSAIYDASWREPRLRSYVALDFGPGAPSYKRVQQLVTRSTARALWKKLGVKSIGLAEHAEHDLTPSLTVAALNMPADLYIAHYVAALPAAARAAKRYNSLYAYDAEDFHLGDWPQDPAFDAERRLVRTIEGRYLPNCAFLTAASPMIAEALVEEYGIRFPSVVLNVFPKSQCPGKPSMAGTARPGPSIYWFSQTIGPDRGLECAVRAISLARSRPHLFLRGALARGFRDSLTGIAHEYGVSDRLHILSPAPPEQMERLTGIYDLGLCSEPGHTRNNRRALSNKLFSFLLAGVPPVLSNTPAQQRFAMENGLQDLIYQIDDAPALADRLDHFLHNPTLLSEMRARVWQLGQNRYNWDYEASILTELVARCLNRVLSPVRVA